MLRKIALPLLLAALAASGCGTCGGEGAPGAAVAEADDPVHPPSDADVATTDGAIAFGNLEGQIQVLEADVAQNPRRVDSKLQLVDLIALRGLYTARVADYERALALADEATHDAPERQETWLSRASARSTLHLFAEARADLDEAEKRGAKPAQTRAARAALLQAQGDLDGALTLRHAESEARPDLSSLAAEAALLGEMGRTDDAAKLFDRAFASYKGVFPFPVAWALFQEGTMWERAGKKSRARAFYAAARERLPVYVHASLHEAQLEPTPRAIELLTVAVEKTDDPEIELGLADRLREHGDAAEAQKRIEHVKARYDELVAKHPAAFADHAGWFWLQEGKDPAKAFSLAKRNLALRKTDRAYQLAVLSASAAGASDEACTLAKEGAAIPHATEVLRGLAATACGHPAPAASPVH